MFEHDPFLFYAIIGVPSITIGMILFDKFLNWYLNSKGVISQ